ncbi:COP9 signalosome complex subunit 7b [Kickxella alabastrina]|uniref:COP9 signalosome complex subunit 7b n=1 Tax=Kickxella alabastrina TaxID=61397 RepID=A0ACC1IFQ0_9FUNG|nr:COP9 signalosome complex subunit 7b [Kickxella alabastrina]
MEFCLIALKTAASEADIVAVIQKALDDERVYHFGRLLEAPSIAKLAESQEFSAYWNLLQLFSFGTLSEYRAAGAQLPELSEQQIEKLKHLTLVSLASDFKILEYDLLLKELDCQSEQQMEDLVIEATYRKLLSGKLDQQRRLIEVDYVVGRDVRREDLQKISNSLNYWSLVCEDVLADISKNIELANSSVLTKRKEEREFASALQEVRASQFALSKARRSGGESVFEPQYASSEYQREDIRTRGRAP